VPVLELPELNFNEAHDEDSIVDFDDGDEPNVLHLPELVF